MVSFDKPILFLVFNRPDHTARVFERIREVKPRYLFVAADGPRKNHPEDLKKCESVRKTILASIDWNCELKTLFRDNNLGCGLGVSGAITWFFEQVEDGIILEDDCLPDITFFDFCKTLLAHYADDKRVMHISGNNFQGKIYPALASYYFSSYPHIWGWATWRRSWRAFDFALVKYDVAEIRTSMKWYGFGKKERNHWCQIFEKQADDSRVDTWDYQWTYAVFSNKGLSIVPQRNLVKNIGFGDEATHTPNENENYSKVQHENLIGEIIHPTELRIDKKADRYVFNRYYDSPGHSFLKAARDRMSHLFPFLE